MKGQVWRAQSERLIWSTLPSFTIKLSAFGRKNSGSRMFQMLNTDSCLGGLTTCTLADIHLWLGDT